MRHEEAPRQGGVPLDIDDQIARVRGQGDALVDVVEADVRLRYADFGQRAGDFEPNLPFLARGPLDGEEPQ